MPRVLIMQTTRMGDTLQTSPLIRQARRVWPDAHIAVMVRGMGRGIVERHPDVDEVILYNEDEMFLHMQSQDSGRYLEAYRLARELVDRLRTGRFDIAVNVTHSLASAMLLKMAEIPRVIGAHLSDDWHLVLRGGWTTYFFTSVYSREFNDLNLCDITRHFVPASEPCRELILALTAEDLAAADALLAEHGVDPTRDFIVCMQLGASESIKRWSEERFAELALLLRERWNARIFLVGVQSEAPLGEAFARVAPDAAVPLFGKTTLPQLAALLSRSRFLVTNDTGTMHIAAAVKCPVVLVSVGPVHYRETGPFGEGHCAVEWRRPWAGRSDISRAWEEERTLLRAPQVMRAVELLLDGTRNFTPARQMREDELLSQVDIQVTRFAPDGCLEYYPAIRRTMTETDFLRAAYRAMWLEHLSEEQGSASRETESLETFVSFFDPPTPETVNQWLEDHQETFREMANKAETGRELCDRLITHLENRGSMIEARNMVREMMRLDEAIRVFSEVHHGCRPLATMARFERDNLEGMDPLPLARATRNIYAAMVSRALLLRKKITLLAQLVDRSPVAS